MSYFARLDHFRAPEARVARARQLLGTLQRQLQRWTDAQGDHIGLMPDSGKLRFAYVSFDYAHLTRASVTMGEIVYNLRSALDFTVYELAVIGTGEPVDGTQFPIEDKPGTFDNLRVLGLDRKGKPVNRGQYLRGVPDYAIRVIRELQPFNGCTWTAELQDLSNPDKHRHLPNLRSELIPTVHETTIRHNPDTGHQTLNVRYSAEVEVRFADGRPVIETLQALHREVKATVALLKSLADQG